MHPRSLLCAIFLTLISLPHTASRAQESADEAEINAFYQNVIGALASQPRPVFPIEAEALIAFTVSSEGGIDSIDVAQSSGSNPLDVAALEIVLNAAPFPTPPLGARRNLSITIKSTRPELGFGNLDRLRQ